MDSKGKILIAEDEPDVLQVMAKRIKEEGYDVAPAHDGEEAWNKIRSEEPDVILLDLVMPKMSGFEVLKSLRQNPPSQKWQPVIIVSAKDELDDMHKGFQLEADHYLTKPCSMDDVMRGIRLMLSLIPQRVMPSDGEHK